jgi:hypothetical protein
MAIPNSNPFIHGWLKSHIDQSLKFPYAGGQGCYLHDNAALAVWGRLCPRCSRCDDGESETGALGDSSSPAVRVCVVDVVVHSESMFGQRSPQILACVLFFYINLDALQYACGHAIGKDPLSQPAGVAFDPRLVCYTAAYYPRWGGGGKKIYDKPLHPSLEKTTSKSGCIETNRTPGVQMAAWAAGAWRGYAAAPDEWKAWELLGPEERLVARGLYTDFPVCRSRLRLDSC